MRLFFLFMQPVLVPSKMILFVLEELAQFETLALVRPP
jgi:hypothetical protein